jgi:hypothetical protein
MKDRVPRCKKRTPEWIAEEGMIGIDYKKVGRPRREGGVRSRSEKGRERCEFPRRLKAKQQQQQ